MKANLTVLDLDVLVDYEFYKGWCGSREEPPEPDEYEINEVKYDEKLYEELEIDDQEFDEILMKVLEQHHADEITEHKISMLDDNGWY